MSSAANPSSRLGQFGLGLSIVVHAGAFLALTAVPRTPAPAPLASVVEFEVAKAPEPAPPEPKKEPPPPPPPDPLPLEPASLREAPAPAQAEPPPAAAPKPEPPAGDPPVADLTGLTLTNDTGSDSWGSRVGNGNAIDGPIRAGSNRRQAATRAVTAPTTAARASNVVPLADLSSRPVPPKLDGVLERHYPEVARQQGKSGTAIVRLRIDADGRVRTANIVSESDSGFGRACHATVLGSKWSAPRDQSGNAVATFVSYTCRFRSNQ